MYVGSILGDLGAVSRAGIKGLTEVFKRERESPWVPTLTGPFPTIKRMLAPDWAQKCIVLLGPIGEQYLLSSSFGELVHDGYCLVIVARFVHKGCACKENFHFLLS